MSNNFISAGEARIKSAENADKEVSDELDSIFKKINEAIDQGHCIANWNKFISVPVNKKLQELGYKVDYTFHKNEYEYTIKWY